MADASAVVALMIDAGPDGEWSAGLLANADLAAPHLFPFEVANILRRKEIADVIDRGQAVQSHADLLSLPVQTWPYEVLAERAWELRSNLSIYDASYVALAELLGAPLVTLDRRIARAPGPRCDVLTPPEPDD